MEEMFEITKGPSTEKCKQLVLHCMNYLRGRGGITQPRNFFGISNCQSRRLQYFLLPLTRGRHGGGGRVGRQRLPHEAVGLLLLRRGRLVLSFVVRQGLVHVRGGGRRVEVHLWSKVKRYKNFVNVS